jgi:hypothetical protein
MNESFIEALETLNLLEYNVVEFINPITQKSEYYIINGKFDPDQDLGSRKIMKHVIWGRNVTRLINEKTTLFTHTSYKVQEQGLRESIDQLPIVKREYSSHFIWKAYLI